LSGASEVSNMMEGFRSGGWGMFPTLIFGVVLLGVAMRYLIEPHKRLVPLLLSLGVLTMAAGALGFVTGLIKSIEAVARTGGDRAVLALIGAGEAANCIGLALVIVVLAAMATSGGALRLARSADAAR
jgi:hypothetical protein